MRALVLAGLLAVACSTAARAEFIFVTDGGGPQFNTVDLFMTSPGSSFGAAAPLFSSPNAPWGTAFNTGASIRYQTSNLATSGSLLFFQTFVGGGPSYQISYQVGFWDGVSLSGGYSGSTTVAGGGALIAPVPEPSSMLLCGMGLGFMGIQAWRRRRAGQPEPAEDPAAEP